MTLNIMDLLFTSVASGILSPPMKIDVSFNVAPVRSFKERLFSKLSLIIYTPSFGHGRAITPASLDSDSRESARNIKFK